ncbi:MAG: hypothetical protein MUC50_00960 [Myxococcota bacterium]|nr:hypothetical protein [Myxococcota bacterium]
MSQDNDRNDFQGVGSPDGQVPLPAGDADVQVSNTGQRIRAVLVILVLLGGLGAGLYWWNGKQEQIARHEAARVAFEAAHRNGYAAFWTKTQVNIKAMKSNRDFEGRMRQILRDDPVRYAKHLEENAIPVLAAALPGYKKIEAPAEYADKVEAVAKAAEAMFDSWKAFAAELGHYKGFLEAKGKLSDHGDQWFGAQQSNADKFTAKAQRYHAVLRCILKDKKLEEIVPNEVSAAIQDSCRSDKPEWFRRVAFDCLQALVGEQSEADKAGYASTVAAFRKSKAERLDHNSVFGIDSCLGSTRDALEAEMTESLAKTWTSYVVAQNALLDTIKTKIKELR